MLTFGAIAARFYWHIALLEIISNRTATQVDNMEETVPRQQSLERQNCTKTVPFQKYA